MKLRKIEIHNYRKFKKSILTFDDNITLLAGANNSGKTSIIEILDQIINVPNTKFNVSDLPIELINDWINKSFPIFVSEFEKDSDTDTSVKNIISTMFNLEQDSTTIPLPYTNVLFTIDYDPSFDDIRNFADFIMDFDPHKHSFYFIYRFSSTPSSFSKVLSKNFEKIKSRYKKIINPDEEKTKITSIKEKIISIFVSSFNEQCFFSDSKFNNKNEIDTKDFKKLFNFYKISASRSLDDQSTDKSKSLSKNIINLTSHHEDWKLMIEDLPDKVLQRLESENITSLVQRTSINILSEAVNTISETNGGNTGKMVLNLDVTEDAIRNLIMQITSAKYHFQEYYLNESSQGLGYSNMIYILVQLESYKQSINPLLVNMFFIEEPESHMHPQMQNVFGKYLKKYYKKQKIQGLITTHSSEIVRVTDMKKLRISRSLDSFNSDLLDFTRFKINISNDPELDNFYDWFYEIGFSEVIFADRVILYEGDTERLLIRKLSTFKDFNKLNQLYIAFVQVGGAYGYNYKQLIEFLKIKTLIITDLDYDKKAKTIQAIEQSKITNATIKNFYKDSNNNIEPKVNDLYLWKENDGNIVLDGLAYLCYQQKEDGYSRTLEEAILSKHYGINSTIKKRRSSWKNLRDKDNLKYTIPNDNKLYTIRDIVAHSSSAKTDFMYSLILQGYTESVLPNYIKEGLQWLMK